MQSGAATNAFATSPPFSAQEGQGRADLAAEMQRQHDRLELYFRRKPPGTVDPRRDRVYKANYLDKPHFKDWLTKEKLSKTHHPRQDLGAIEREIFDHIKSWWITWFPWFVVDTTSFVQSL